MTLPKTHPLYGAVEALARDECMGCGDGLPVCTPDRLATCQGCLGFAIQRIRALESAGYRVVGPEPTLEMCKAVPRMPAIHAVDDLPLKDRGFDGGDIINFKRLRAGIAAAPTITETEKGNG